MVFWLVNASLTFFFSILGLLLVGWVILLTYVLACIDTRANGFFLQDRVGKDGRLFKVIKNPNDAHKSSNPKHRNSI